MHALSLRPATVADVPFLVELRRATMAPHEVAAGRVRSPEESLARVLAAFDAAQIIIRCDQAVGLLKVDRSGSPWELLQVQVLPDFQRQSIGTQVMHALIVEARAADVSVRLSVLKANPARRLYERLGFTVAQEKATSCVMALSA